MLYRLAHTPKGFLEHSNLYAHLHPDISTTHILCRMAGSLILNVGYGIDAQSLDDPYLKIVQKPVDILTAGANPASFLVNSIPIREYQKTAKFIN